MTLAPIRGSLPLLPRALCAAVLWFVAPAVQAGDIAVAFARVAEGDLEAAEAEVATEPMLARDLVLWSVLARGQGSFDAYLGFLTRHPDWPGIAQIRRAGEGTIGPETPPDQVLAYFGTWHAQTPHGALYLAQALTQAARDNEARAEIVLAWRQQSFSRSEQAIFMREFGPLLERHNGARLDWLLWRGLSDQAERMYPYLTPDERALARARIALRKNDKGVTARIKAVPVALADDPGLAYERFRWRLNHGLTDAAEELLLARSATAESLGQPGFWASDRRTLARDALRAGRAQMAYDLAANHHLTSGEDFADLEFLAGYVALTRLDKPAVALKHFRRLEAGVDSPISLGRAAYWEARAYAALDQPDAAQVAMAYGAEFQTGFYGLLAAEAAGLPMDPALAETGPPGPLPETFMGRDLLRAGLMLRDAGETQLAARFFLQLAEELSDDDLTRLADLTVRLDEPYLALLLAKYAAERGVVLVGPYFPLSTLPQVADVPPELVLSIIRRESEFNPGVVSRAGARGLMQLMPRTAKAVAESLDEADHHEARLLAEPDYNVRLGTAYLERLIGRFGGNVLLVAAAYNAGPTRVERWLKTLGDPRDEGTDPLDWIESIPFRETRNYVMRVAESVVIYRARLAGVPQPIRLAEELKG